MLSWVEAYESFNNMTISELKELLKAADLPVSGKKHDLISYLVFKDYPDLKTTLPKYHSSSYSYGDRAIWLKKQYETHLLKIFYASINRQFLPLLMARLK